MSIRDRLGSAEHSLAKALLSLPHPLLRLLSGGAAVRRGEDELHPEMQLILSMRERLGGRRLGGDDLAKVRADVRREARVHAGVPAVVASVRDFRIPGEGGALPVRHYAPRTTEPRPPLIVFFHGGGFVFGDLDSHDALCRVLCRDAGAHVLAVDYRLAPEHPYPAAVNDARAAFRWAHGHAAELGADPERVGVAGDSAGGNLAAVTTLFAKRDGEAMPAFQALLYPTCDRTRPWDSLDSLGDGFFLTREDIAWFFDQYTRGTSVPRSDPGISPLCASPLPRLAPAIVLTAAFDPLRDEGDAYAAALRASGTPTVHLRAAGVVHGFLNMIALSAEARAQVRELTATLRGLFAGLSAASD